MALIRLIDVCLVGPVVAIMQSVSGFLSQLLEVSFLQAVGQGGIIVAGEARETIGLLLPLT